MSLPTLRFPSITRESFRRLRSPLIWHRELLWGPPSYTSRRPPAKSVCRRPCTPHFRARLRPFKTPAHLRPFSSLLPSSRSISSSASFTKASSTPSPFFPPFPLPASVQFSLSEQRAPI